MAPTKGTQCALSTLSTAMGPFVSLNLTLPSAALRVTLKRGDVLQLVEMFPLHFDHGDSSISHVVLMVKNYVRCGATILTDDFVGSPPPGSSLAVRPPPESHPALAIRGGGDENINENSAEAENEAVCIDCDGSRCSLCGIQFDRCVAEVSPVDDIVMKEVARECFFVDKPVEEMSLSEKRNILYYWYATNVFGICGKNHVAYLPMCLVWKIRGRFREPDGVYRTDGTSTRRVKRKKK